MKTITKKYLEEEIASTEELNAIMNGAAGMNPFGVSIDLASPADEALKGLEDRVRVQIWQSHRIKVLKSLLEELD